MPAVPMNISGLRPQWSTVAMAITVNSTPEPPMMAWLSMPASTPVLALMLLKMVVPKYMKTLMPVTCWRMASAMPRMSGTASRGENNSRQVPCSPASDSRTAAASVAANSAPATLARMMRAWSSRFCSISQRGLSGMPKQQQREQHRGQDAGGEHPAPAGVDVPGLPREPSR